MDKLIYHPYILICFGIVVIGMLLLDLGVLNKNEHTVGTREAAIWSAVWIGLSMLFSLVIFRVMGFDNFARFQSAYWIEKALSVDNLFVFILVFKYFQVPSKLHHKVLFWGVLGALFFRALFIFSGVELINLTYLPSFHLFGTLVRINVLLTVFGVFLVVAGFRSWFSREAEDEEKDFSATPGARLVHRFFKVSEHYGDGKFFTIETGIKMATPLLVVLAVIEFTDLLFAVDSIPAIFAIAPNDPFILYTSNIFAILGLRALYFLLANFMDRFSKLKYGLAVILAFIGVKMIVSPVLHISSTISLSVVGGVLLIATVASFATTSKS